MLIIWLLYPFQLKNWHGYAGSYQRSNARKDKFIAMFDRYISFRLWVGVVFGVMCFVSLSHADQWDYKNYVSVNLLKGHYQSDALVGIEFNLKPGWKIYNDQEQEIGLPTSFQLKNSDNVRDFRVVYPQAKKFLEAEKFVTYGYRKNVVFPLYIFPIDKQQNISADLVVKYAVCKELCIPVTEMLRVDLPSGFVSSDNTKLINKYQKFNIAILSIILGAVIAGFVLNFMPCVLPVLLLKVVSFLEKSNTDRKTIIIASFSTIIGILFTFVVLASFVMMLKLMGSNLGWGMHFQEPFFIGFLIIILVVFASNILGYFNVAIPGFLLTRINNMGNRGGMISQHFFTGVLATLLATPCSAPFLGPVLSFALTTSYFNILLVFISIGIGLALPYILLIIAPQILHFLPKPGKWMEKLKELMAVFLMVTALWLLIVIYRQIGVYGGILFFMEVIIFAKMIKHHHKIISLVGKNIFKILLLVNILICVFVISAYRGHSVEKAVDNYWLDFNSVKVEDLLQKHNGVFVNVTADWCLTCKVNEVFILNSRELRNSFREYDIVMVKADYTNHDKNIDDYLRSFDRYAIPTYVLYSENYPTGRLLSEINSKKYLRTLAQEIGNAKTP